LKAKTAGELYTLERPDFYDAQSNSLNPLRRWFHRTRHTNVRRLVEKHHSGDRVVDVGCGNVVWNWNNTYPVIGVDINSKALEYNLAQGRIIRGVCSPVEDLHEIASGTIGLAVCSEVLEHVPGFWKVVAEVYRILRPGGKFVVTVPYDTTLSLWRPLFWLQCLYQGRVRGDEYYKLRCGHVNYFCPRTIRMYLESAGFEFVEQFDMRRFTIFTVVQKPQ